MITSYAYQHKDGELDKTQDESNNDLRLGVFNLKRRNRANDKAGQTDVHEEFIKTISCMLIEILESTRQIANGNNNEHHTHLRYGRWQINHIAPFASSRSSLDCSPETLSLASRCYLIYEHPAIFYRLFSFSNSSVDLSPNSD